MNFENLEISKQIQFWFHPISGGSGIQYFLEYYCDIKFSVYEKEKVDSNKTNILIFLWEPKNEHTKHFNFKTNKPEFFSLLAETKELGFVFLADYTTESNFHVDSEREDFLNELSKIGINHTNFYLVTNISNFKHQILKYGKNSINYIHFPHFLTATPIEMMKYVENPVIDENRKPSKDFLCLNRRMHSHKFKFLKSLWTNNLLERTHWTWVCNYINLNDYASDEFVKYLGLDVDNFSSIQLSDDVLYGTQLDKADQFLYTINPKWYYDSKVNVIVESNFGNRPIHITEKTFKPIFLGIPFVIFASKGHLEKLKELGFDCFQSVIGDYDCTNESSVIESALRLVDNYNSDEVIAICKKNQSVLLDKTNQKNIIYKYFLSNFKKSAI
jgi:hypothetical protein